MPIVPLVPPMVKQRQKQVERYFRKGYKNRSLHVCEGQGVVSCALALRGVTRAFDVSVFDAVLLGLLTQNREGV